MILWIILIVILLACFFIKKTREGMNQIPENLFQTWTSKNLPPNMKACVSRLKRQNPEFNHYLYDDDDCRAFIEKHFDSTVLASFDALIPGCLQSRPLEVLCLVY